MARPTLIRVEDASALEFDGAAKESFSPSVTVTDHPVEVGVAVTDHARLDPLSFGVDAFLSESPYARPGVVSAGQARIDAARAWLEASAGKVLTVRTSRGGTVANAMLTGWAYEYSASLGLTFKLTFKQIRIALSQQVRIPSLVSKAAPSAKTSNTGEEKAGAQPLAPADKSGAKIAADFLVGAAGSALNLGGP
jgi:hypothetical protein